MAESVSRGAVNNKDLLVVGGTIVSSQGQCRGDVWLAGGKIRQVFWRDSAATDAASVVRDQGLDAEVMDVTGMWVLPGIIDSQVHFREPGLEHKEDLASGSLAALLGGVTTFLEMPNTNPPTITREHVEYKLSLARKKSHVNYGFFIGATADHVAELGKASSVAGCVGIKIFLGSSTGDLLLYDPEVLERIFRSTSAASMTISIHSENEMRLRDRRSFKEQATSVSDHLLWRDEEVAFSSTKMVVELARKCRRPIHILHVSSASEMRYLAQQKDQVTVEVTPQHLSLWAPDCYEQRGTLAQMNPPIRSGEHRQALWQGVADGTVDVVASDHAPHTLEEKALGYPHSPAGMPGVQTLLPVMLHHVRCGKLTLERLVSLVCERPAELFSLNKGRIQAGYDADLTIVDPRRKTTLTHGMMASRCSWTPFHNMKVEGGYPVAVIIGGQRALEDGALTEDFLEEKWGVAPAVSFRSSSPTSERKVSQRQEEE